MATVTYTYTLGDDDHLIAMHSRAADFYDALHDIDQMCRSVIKYEEEPYESRVQLAEAIRELVSESRMGDIL